MRIFTTLAVVVSALCSSVQADIALTGAAAVELTKKCQDATKGNLDGSWIRAEPKLAGSLANLGLTGVIHLRFQYDMAGAASDTPKVDMATVKNQLSTQARQVYFKLPVSVLEIMGGRWYEVYGPGNSYFGRYLHGVTKDKKTKQFTGNGSMNTNYSVLDGFRLALNIKPIKSALTLAVLPKDTKFDNDYIMAMFGGSPVEGLQFNIAGNFEAIRPETSTGDPTNRFMVNCGYTILKDLKLGLFGEMAIINMSEASDNMWFLAGVTTKAGPVLDKFQIELEIKNHRAGDPTTDKNLAWMVMLQKKVLGLTLDLNVGADPTVLGSKTAGDVGAIFRTTASF